MVIDKGFDDLIKAVDTLGKDSTGLIKTALYDASHITYEEVQANIKAIDNISDIDRRGLLTSLYHSKMYNEGNTIYEVIGFTGYNDRGAPNIEVARSIISGSSTNWHKVPFMRKALNKTKPQFVRKMQEVINKAVGKIEKGQTTWQE